MFGLFEADLTGEKFVLWFGRLVLVRRGRCDVNLRRSNCWYYCASGAGKPNLTVPMKRMTCIPARMAEITELLPAVISDMGNSIPGSPQFCHQFST